MKPLLTKYKDEVIPALMQQFDYKNIHQVPVIEKIVINCGVGRADSERKQAVQDALDAISLVTGQKGVATVSKNSISNFKLRAGELVGAKVTLRGERMYEFLLRLIGTAIPSIRDFRGVSSKAFDGRGNYTLGIVDYTIFPEVELDKVQRQLGFDVCFVTSSNTDDEARELLHLMGMPFRGREKKAA